MLDSSFPRIRIISALVLTLLLAAGCGGGGTSTDVVGSGGTGSISGVATKGPISNATITGYGISGGQMGSQIGTATTDANGSFTMSIGAYAGPVMMKVSEGTYKDEATGSSMGMASGDVMTAVMPSVAAGVTNNGIQVTPVTAMAQAMAQSMAGGMTEANIAAANAAMGNYFMVSDILHVQPMNPLMTGSGAGANQDARNYGMTMAAMSQYAKTLSMSASSAMVTAMMNDASDGVVDGRKGVSQISMSMGGMMGTSMMSATAGTSSLATAMTDFMGSAANASGVTTADMTVLTQKLAKSNGHI